MHARFYAPDASVTGQIVTLTEDEATHLSRVLRLRPGDEVRVFDGRGHEFDAVIERVAAGAADVQLGAARTPAPERRVAITLAQAVLKGDKMDDVVRDATMMGVTVIQPLVASRSEVTAATLIRGRRRERWERIAVASAKQCGRAVVPSVRSACTLPELFDRTAHTSVSSEVIVFVEPGAMTRGDRLRDVPSAPPAAATVVIGPEGGWTLEEIAQWAGTFRLVTLSGPTLRADAMPLAALSALLTSWGEL